MSEQLCLFETVSDNDRVSLTDNVSDVQTTSAFGCEASYPKRDVKKQQAIQKYLNRASKETTACITTYSPGRRKTEYYRLSYRVGRKVKHIHLRGGSTIAELATYRAKVLQAMIDRGAELSEVLAAVATFNSGGS